MTWILLNGYSEEVKQHPNIGGLIQPRNWARARPWVAARRPWAVDNDYKRFDPGRFVQLLTRIHAEHPDPTSSGCLFVAVPDVYRDHAATLALWRKWRDVVWGSDMPPAFVVQNGAHISNVPWRDFRTLWRGASYYRGCINKLLHLVAMSAQTWQEHFISGLPQQIPVNPQYKPVSL